MTNLIKKIGANQYGVIEYAVSNESEVAQIPHLIGQGSTCIVIATSNVYMFDEEDLCWHSLVDGSVIKPNSLKAIEKAEPINKPKKNSRKRGVK